MFIYIDIHTAIQKHDEIINKSGGYYGVQNRGLLESCLEHVQNDKYYPEFIDKITHLVNQVNRQLFVDGSKRSAIALGAYFLEINDFNQMIVNNFITGMENPILLAAQGKFTKDDIRAVIFDLIYNIELSEQTKARFIKLLN